MPRPPLACGLCRRAKVICDHQTPSCGRCLRRGLLCVYQQVSLPTSRTRATVVVRSVKRPSNSILTDSRALDQQSPRSSASETAGKTGPYSKPRNVYATAPVSAVFFENLESLMPTGSTEEVTPASDSSPNHGLRPTFKRKNVTSAQINQGAQLLLGFPTAHVCDVLLEQCPFMFDIWLSPKMIRQCLSQIWTDYGSHLSQPRSMSQITQMSRDLCEECHYPMLPDEDIPWLNWFGGRRLRWEMLAIIFSFAGLAFKQLQERDPVFNMPDLEGTSRDSAAEVMQERALGCLRLCENADTEVNDVRVIAMKNVCKLHAFIVPEYSDQTELKVGMVLSAAISTGLHRLPFIEEVTPLSEHRTALSAHLYCMDKGESLCNGHPPMLSRQFCTYHIPLDLGEDDLFGSTDMFLKGKARLDSNGWDTSGEIHPLTWVRAQCLQIPIREKIVEISLSVNQNFEISQIESLNNNLEEIVASYPAKIQYQNIEQWSQKQAAPELYIVTRIHLEFLRYRFLIQRLLITRSSSTCQILMDIAQEMLTTVTWFWLNRDQLQRFNFAFDSMVVCYGIPAAGVLCVELLRSTKGYRGQTLQFSSSRVIQSLTLFAGFLDWVRPTDNNFEICRKLSKVIKRIVDDVLSSPVLKATRPEAQSLFNHDITGFDGGLNAGDNADIAMMQLDDLDDLGWLNTVDWTQGDWLDMNQQTLF